MDRAKVPQIAPPPHLPAGFVVLSGGCDFKGYQIACFPPKSLIRMHVNSVTSPDLVTLVEYYIGITKPEQRMNGLAFLADFRACSQSIFRVIIDALDTMQRQNRGSVAVFYVMMPRGKELVKSLQKLLGVYQKKSFFGRKSSEPPQVRSFQSVLLSNPQELYQFVSRDQLMSDFGGTLNYDHEAWMKLRKTFDQLLSQVNTITETVPEALSRLEMLKEFEHPVDEDECQEMVRWMQNRFQEVTSELMLEPVSEQVGRLAEACRRPEMNPDLLPLARNPLLAPHAERMERLAVKLEEMRQLLRRKWREAEAKLIFIGQLAIYQKSGDVAMEGLERAAAAATRIRSGDIASQTMAEDARERLRLLGSEPAAARLAEVREVMKKTRRLAMSASDPADPVQRQPGAYAAELEARMKGCADIVKAAEDWMAAVSGFFDCCGRILRWYKHCLERLPLELLSHHERMKPAEALNLTSRWVEAARPVITRHPCPKPAELDELRQGMAQVENPDVSREANLLLHRVEVLTKLLDQRNITVREFRELLDWRAKEQSQQGDPDIAVLEPSPNSQAAALVGADAPDFFEAELRDLEDSISQHQGQQDPAGQADNMSSLTTGSSDARKYRKRREARLQQQLLHQQPSPQTQQQTLQQQTQQQPAVREYRPRSNLGVEVDDGPQGVALESQPKTETVWKFLDNMASPHSSDSFPASYKTDERDDSLNNPASSLEYPFASQGNDRRRGGAGPRPVASNRPAAARARQAEQPLREAPPPRSTRSLGSSSQGGHSLSDLVGELKELGDALFGGGKQHPRGAPPVSRKQQKSRQEQQRKQGSGGADGGSLPLRGTRSVDNLLFVSPEGDPMRRVAAPRFLGGPDASATLPLPSRATSERLLLVNDDDDDWMGGSETLAPEEFALLAVEPPLYSNNTRQSQPAGRKAKSDSGLSAVSAVDSALANWRRDRDDRERQERDQRLQELLREADRCLAQPDLDNQSDSGLSDHTIPQSVIDYRSRAAWGKPKPAGPATVATAAAPTVAASANQDSGRPGSETDDIDQIINDIHEIAAGRYPEPPGQRQPPTSSAARRQPPQQPQLQAAPQQPRGRAFSDYDDEDARQHAMQQYQQPHLPPHLHQHLHPPMSRMSDTDLVGAVGSPSSLLRQSRHSDNFLLGAGGTGSGGSASAARSHSPLLASPPPSIPEDDLDDRSLRSRQQRQQQRQYLNVRRYNRDTPDAINPLSNGELQEQLSVSSGAGGGPRRSNHSGVATPARAPLHQQLQQHQSGSSVFY